MKIPLFLIRPYARYVSAQVSDMAKHAISDQKKIILSLVRKAMHTQFGKAHGFSAIRNYEEFSKQVPIRDYEAFQPYIESMLKGEKHILWPGRPKYWAKTSGTTAGVKYIPISHESVHHHYLTAQAATMHYMAQQNRFSIMSGKMIFLSGSPKLDHVEGIPAGRLSGIVNHQVPDWLRTQQLPTHQTNCIEDWEAKLDQIVEETLHQPMTLIGGIPPWVQMYFERIQQRTGKTVSEAFPTFEMLVYGGVHFEPYRSGLETLMGRSIASLETYPASEGFIAFQDDPHDPGLLLNTRAGMFFECIPAEEALEQNPTRLPLWEVEVGKNYALVMSTNAGLWSYLIGDTVRFTSLHPYKVIVTGRIKHFISAFGEHVIGEEVEKAMLLALQQAGGVLKEFTVSPKIENTPGESCHEWWIEFKHYPENLALFSLCLDQAMQAQNIYYRDLRAGNILRTLRIHLLKENAFRDMMKLQGKLGGQNKVPRLSNDTQLAAKLHAFIHPTPNQSPWNH